MKSLKDLMAELARKKAASSTDVVQLIPPDSIPPAPSLNKLDTEVAKVIQHARGPLVLDTHQNEFIRLALEHTNTDEPIILIGAAGTGKTTTVGKLIERIFSTFPLVPIHWAHKHLPGSSVGILICSFTRRATNNIRKKLPLDLQGNCITIHKLLEFEPEYMEIQDMNTREWKTTMRFAPQRTKDNKLVHGLKYLIVEEYSMLGADLWAKVKAALPDGVRIIFVGDIYQLPPVMDIPAVAPYLCVSPTVELQTVYRTALDNPIIKYATDIRNGRGFSVPDVLRLEAKETTGSLTFRPWKGNAKEEIVIAQLGKFLRQEYINGHYDPEDSQILIPWNKRLGSIELNRWIATAIAVKNDREVHEVIVGYEKKYFSVGDKCLWDKNDCEILHIERNPAYMGNLPRDADKTLDYWGHCQSIPSVHISESSAIDEVEAMLNAAIASDVVDGERVKQCSHKITVLVNDTQQEVILKGAGEIQTLDLSYAMTIHKAQGSEWRKVYLCFHKIHAVTLSRELLYAGFTRAKEELYVICDKDTFVTGVQNQAIKGVTLQQKADTLRLKAKLAAKGLR